MRLAIYAYYLAALRRMASIDDQAEIRPAAPAARA